MRLTHADRHLQQAQLHTACPKEVSSTCRQAPATSSASHFDKTAAQEDGVAMTMTRCRRWHDHDVGDGDDDDTEDDDDDDVGNRYIRYPTQKSNFYSRGERQV